MRIISGSLKGRTIKGYNITGTRPTMDRIKESIFGIIQNHIRDSVVLDLFAGSGNYGIESISNGAKVVYFNDFNKKCTKVIMDNVREFKIDKNSIVLNMDYKKALLYFKDNKIKFDLIFIDPPYKENIISDILIFISDNDILNNSGLVICELTKNDLLDDYKNIKLYKSRKYGEKEVVIYRNDN